MVNLITFIAGVGVFLFGIDQLEKALKSLSSRSMRSMLRQHTNTPLKSIFSGTLATAILQSSSVVGLMTLAFVGAGILTLNNALGIIIGANLGTTFTGWLVATLGFKLNLTSFYLPILGLGALGLVILKDKDNKAHFSRLAFGFGLLLMGLVVMKGSIETFAESFDVAIFKEYGVLVFFLVGVIFTAIIQSSSATMMITLSALSAGIIELPAAAALVIGADLGTTGTVLLGALNGTAIKRQVAAAHFIFNLTVDLLALAALPLLLYLITDIFQLGDDPLLGLVALHSTFNALGILIFLPFLNFFAKTLQKLFKDNTGSVSLHLHLVPSTESDAALHALKKETRHLLGRVFELISITLGVKNTALLRQVQITFEQDLSHLHHNPTHFVSRYEDIKRLEAEIIDYGHTIRPSDQSQHANSIDRLLEVTRKATHAIKETKDIRDDRSIFDLSDSPLLLEIREELQQRISQTLEKALALYTDQNLGDLPDQLEKTKHVLKQHTHDLYKDVYACLHADQVSEEVVSSLLNLIGESLLACRFMIEAVELYAMDSNR